MHKTYWLISVPKEGQDTLSKLNATLQRDHDEVRTHKFEVPDLTVGTLDSLLSLSDDLYKYDSQVYNITLKIAHVLHDLLGKSGDSLAINGTNIDTFLTRFPWDEARYPTKDHIRDLSDRLRLDALKMEEDLKNKLSEYQQISTLLAAEERKKGGTLLQRSLSDIVNKKDIVESDFMTTMFVVVPKFALKAWHSQYESLCEYVLPRSSMSLYEDSENTLFSCVVFKKFADDFKNKARESRFFVRDFDLASAENAESDKEDIKRKENEKEKLKKGLIQWCKINFSESFIAWIHLKAIRIFVESVLRYGLPANFQSVLIKPQRQEDKKLRKTLEELYHNLGNAALMDTGGEEEYGLVGDKEFYPYVYSSIDLDFTH